MPTNFGTTKGAKLVAILFVVALVLVVVVFSSSSTYVPPRVTSQQDQYGPKIVFGRVVSPGQTPATLPAETLAFCKANGWEIELSIPSSDADSYFTNTSNAAWYAGVIQSITNQGIPVWLEIEQPVYYSDNVSVATTPQQYQSRYGAGLAIYEKLGPLFKGYAFEGGYDNAIIWLKANSDRELLAHWIPAYYQDHNTGAPNYTPTNVPEWGTHNMTWRVNQFDEIVWLVYQVDWAQSAVQFKQWLDTVAPSKPFSVLSGWELDGGYWWNQHTHNSGTLYTAAQQQALLTQWLTWLKGQIGPFAGIVCDPGGAQPSGPCAYIDNLNLTNGTPTPTPSVAPTSSPTATPPR